VDFFTQQERSRRATRVLVVLFLLAVALIVLAVTLVVAIVLRLYMDPYGPQSVVAGGSLLSWIADNGTLLAGVAALTALFISLASLYRTATLSRGGAQVARMLGATEVTGEGPDPLRRRLMNVVEEMAIASGVPVPEVFVLEEEQGINAFAAGLSPADAAVAVTRGALEKLDRAELQGVIAHEFSHILNGDMRLNQRLMGLSFGILILALMGRWLLHSMRFTRRSRSGGGMAAAAGIGLAFVLIGYIGLFFGRLIKAGVSRQREMLADASAVQFTRDSSGLAGALKKIGGYTGSLTARDSEEIAHMLFSRGSRAFRGWFATHPPLDERIQALDPSFTSGDYPDVDAMSTVVSDSGAEVLVHSLAGGSGAVAEADILTTAGQSAPHDVAKNLRVAIPDELYHAAHSRDSSLLLILALAIGDDERIRRRQDELLQQQLGSARSAICRKLRDELENLDEKLKLPMLELTIPALKQRPAEQLEFLSTLLKRLTDMNTNERLFDYVLLRLLESYLWDLPNSGMKPPKATRRLSASAAVVTLLRCVAAYGHDNSTAALAAFKAGVASIGKRKARVPEPSFEPLADARNLGDLDGALARLAVLRPRARARVLAAVLACIRHDHHIELAEHELFRAIAATLGCPVPPAAAIDPDV
jgi:Zn-dependent protease with chaperone function